VCVQYREYIGRCCFNSVTRQTPRREFYFLPDPFSFPPQLFSSSFFNKIPTIQQLQKTSKGGDKEGDLLYKPTAKPYTRLNYDKDQPTKSMVGS
jgi:hypothetical protein